MVVADQISTRFGALDRRLAAAVRHALDTAVTYTALAPMNAVHLRMTLIAEILDFEPPSEPPSHRWYEFMVECFRQDSVGLQKLTVRPSGSRSDAAAFVGIDFAESYVTNENEDRIIHDLLVAAGTFLVAESTIMDEQIEQWNIAGQDGFLSEELCSIVGRAGVVGFDLLEHAEAGAWRDLLCTTAREPNTAITNAGYTHASGVSRVHFCDEGPKDPIGASVYDEGSIQPADPPERAASSVVEPSPADGLLSYFFADNKRTWRALMLVASTTVIVPIGILVAIVGIRAVGAVADTVPFSVGVLVLLLGVGVLIGFGLHTRSINRKYGQIAECVRELHEREKAIDQKRRQIAQYVRELSEQETVIDGRNYPWGPGEVMGRGRGGVVGG